MPSPRVYRAEIFEDSDWFAYWRAVGANGVVITPAVVTNYDVYLFDLASNTPGTAIYSSLAQTVVDGSTGFLHLTTPIVDGGWPVDGIGYNVRYQVQNANFPGGQRGARRYQVEIDLNCAASSFTPFGWGKVQLRGEVTTKSRLAA